MARVKKYLGEMVNGKVGNVVFYQLNEKTFVKTVQQRQHDSWTQAQQLHRERFGRACALWRQIKYSQIPQIWNCGAQKMNGYALFIKTNLPAFAGDGSLIDARALKLAAGILSLPQEFTAQRKEPNQPIISVSWQNKAQPKGERLEDELMVISSTGDAYTDVMATNILRKDLDGEFKLPAINVPIKYIYLFFASRDRKEYSESVCFEV
jgi:hypothetical protein